MSLVPASTIAIVHGLALAAATATTKAKTSSSSSYTFLIILAAFLALYMLVLRPRTQRARQAQAQGRLVEVGDEVVTTSGIIGRVVSLTDERATLEVSSGSTMEVVRTAIVRRLDPYQPPMSDDDETGAGHHDDLPDTGADDAPEGSA